MSITDNYRISNNYFLLILVICLHTVKWFQLIIIILSNHLELQVTILNGSNLNTVIWFRVFLSNTNNFQTDLFDPYIRRLSRSPL